MTIICLSGPDGSGKSTLVGMLDEKFRNEKTKAMISWMRGSHTLASVLANLLSKFSTFRGGNNPYYEINIPEKMTRLWQFIEFLSAIPIILSRYVIPSLLGCTVICDRYVPDFIVWVSLTTNDDKYLEKFEARFLLNLSALCDYKAYVYASRDCMRSRRIESERDLEADQTGLYRIIAEGIGADLIDTTEDSPEESFGKILDGIEEGVD